ncbi:MAG TPA: radical SAM protein [Thermoanaerobaculia bacterium]|nr:radical SAM protein [Thermoanaerobaculia bacterium]
MSHLGWRHLTRSDKDAILRGIEDGVAHGGPYHVEIHPADRCNIDCFFCSTAALRGTDEVPMTRFEELLVELKEAGTRSLRLSGGGEPLFHRRIRDFLQAIRSSGLPIENVTTNAVLLLPDMRELLADTCDQVTVSLNTADETTYASMMKTSPRNFQRVVDNVRELVSLRRSRGAKRPLVQLQFLIWKENYRTIPAMYRLAREIGADDILFNGLAFLSPEQQMTAAETGEMMELYEDLVRKDEYVRIGGINSFEQDLSGRLAEMNQRLSAGRGGLIGKASRLLLRDDLTFPEKADSLWDGVRSKLATRASRGLESSCLIGWHSMLIRTTGTVAPCCILQGKELGNVYRQSVQDVWHGEAYTRFRAELTRILREGSSWKHDEAEDQTVDSLCGMKGGCPVGTFYYQPDVRFLRSFNRLVETQ